MDKCSSASSLYSENDLDDPTYVPQESSESEMSFCDDFLVSQTPVYTNTRPTVINNSKLVPYSDTDSNDEAINHTQKGKKRVRNPVNWQKNIRKRKILSGERYVNAKGKLTEGRPLKPPCGDTCRLKCSERFTCEERLNIHSEFWKSNRTWDLKRQFVASCIKSKPVARQRQRDGSKKNKSVSNTYFLNNKNKEEAVCKTFFLNTLSISDMFTRYVLKKTGDIGLVEGDLRGHHTPPNKRPPETLEVIKSHIRKYPTYESHYSRERSQRKYLGNHLNISKMYNMYVEDCQKDGTNPEKKWLFFKVFNEEFNYSFHLPDNDTCDTCDKIDCCIKNEKSDEKLKELKQQKEDHLEEASLRYTLKREDKLNAKESENIKVITADLQKCLPTPSLTNSQSFYLRKLWTLNYTIYDTTENKTHCMIWDETTGGRGGSEMASCFFAWASEELTNTKNLTVWTDNCSGQNRNLNMIFMYIWLMEKSPNLDIINHKFLLAGHTHMEVDGKHSIIERAKKKVQKNTIYTTNDWMNLISTCESKNPFVTRRMALENFFNFLHLKQKNGPLISRKRNTDGGPFLISEAVWLQLRREDKGVVYYKTNFSEDNFKKVDLKRNKRIGLTMPEILPLLRTTRKKISNEKFRDIQTLMQWVPEEYKAYFESIPHGDGVGDFPEEDSTELE